MTALEQDGEVRRRLREELDTTFVVEAAAGTGKTTTLVSRVLALITTGRATLARIIAVTFTDKAAGEMKLRIRAEVEKARSAPGVGVHEQGRLEQALQELEVARIGTIHSLCGDLLRERPLQAQVDPIFEMAAGPEASRLLSAAFDRWFATAVRESPEGIRRLLRRPSRRSGSTARDLLRDAATRLAEHRDFTTAWRRDPGFDRVAAIDAVVERLGELGALAARADRESYLVESLVQVRRFVDELRHRETVSPRDHDGLEAALRDLARARHWGWKGYGDAFGPGLSRAEVIARREEVKAALDELVERCDADLAARLRDELMPVVRLYEQHKAAAGKLDFTDLLLRTRDLVRNQREVREELQRRFSHIFVDEFQDTDPLQADLLRLLAADDPAEADPERVRPVAGKLFVVGDPKQSIYAFRRADVALYHRVKKQLVDHGAELVHLSRSFRAVKPLQDAVNAAFAPAMSAGSATQAEYVPLLLGRTDTPPPQPALVALPVPEPWGEFPPDARGRRGRASIMKGRIDESLPDAVGAFVEWLVGQSGWTVTEAERPGERLPVQPRHICILFKRFKAFERDVTRPYAAALEARRLPHVLVGGRSFHARDEVLALRNALAAIEWPDDELAVFATLRGPLFALQDDALLAFRGAFGRMHPLKPLALEGRSKEVREVAEALALLGALHRRRNRRPIADTITLLLEATRAPAGLAFWSGGEQALANVLQVAELARRFEARAATSFRAFVETLQDEATEAESEEARVIEEGTEGVRLMTVHKAKGLEFPVVILADLNAPAANPNPSRHVDTDRRLWAEPLAGCVPFDLLDHQAEALQRDQEEAVRVTYVAATRARELLVVPAVADAPQGGWLAPLEPVVYPKEGTARSPRPAPACPGFGAEAVLDRPDNAFVDPARSPAPGEHTPQAGEHAVVWWDPRALRLGERGDVALRREEILLPMEPQNAERGAAEYAAWERARRERLDRAAVPSRVVLTAREAAVPAAADFPIEATAVDRTQRPGGRRFGTLVHAVLGQVPLAGGEEAVERISAAQARLVGATPDELAAAKVAVRAALAHPVWRRARGASEVRREAPIVLCRDDGAIVEGVVDLAFRDARGWTVVELKTDAATAAELPREHHGQLALYVQAIAAATNQPVDGVLLLV